MFLWVVIMLKKLKKKSKLSDDSDEVDLSILSEDQLQLIELAKVIYLDATLKEVLRDYDYVAKAKVEDFKANKRELGLLKSLVRNHYGQETYLHFFVTPKNVYQQYLDSPSKINLQKLSYFDQYRLNKKDGKSKFFTELKKILKTSIEDTKADEKRQRILNSVMEDTYLPLLNNTSNSAIPYQNSLYEARKILQTQKEFHKEITPEIIEKIIQLISFRIPYYIGPLEKYEGNSTFAWSTRLKDENVTPFNFNEVIDRGESASNFITRMTNKCSYLIFEDVLPKHSLLYQEMEVRNELNGLNLRKTTEQTSKSYRIPIDLREKIYENLFKNQKKVTHKNLKEFLKKVTNGYEDKNVFGTQKEHEFASSLSSYNDFRNILGKDKLEKYLNEIEHVIRWITIFNEKEIIEEKIRDNFGFISDMEIEKILKLNYSGWGRLSKKALTLECNNESIIDLMRSDDYNFMEALASIKHGFKEEFERINKSNKNIKQSIKYEDVEQLQGSPALKKSIWNSIKVVEELVSIFGDPKNIVIEFAREEGEKKRTVEWKKFWDELVKDEKLKKNDNFKGMFVDIENYSGELNYKLEKLKLYLMQGGRCLYTLEKISLKSLLSESSNGSNNYYEIDHILPRSFVKDDSFDNKALVVKSANQLKSGDRMPLSLKPENNQSLIQYWNLLASNKMLSSKKMNRLMKSEFTDVDKEKFVARQLVETRQITVHVRNLLEERFSSNSEKVNIEVLKANMVSEVRNKLDFPKVRELNDYHHAIDALLIAGTYQYGEEIKPNLFKFDMRKQKARDKWKNIENSNRKFDDELFLITHMKNKKCRNGLSFKEIFEKTIVNNSPIVTKKVENTESAFYKESIYSPKEKTAKYTSGKVNKFVHDEVKKSFAVFISYFVKDKKGALKYQADIIDVTNIERAQNTFNNDTELATFFAKKKENNNEVVNPKLHLKLQKGDLIFIKDNPFYFVSSGELVNAKQLELPLNLQKLLKKNLNKWKYDSEEAKEVYRKLSTEILDQYKHILPVNTKKFEERSKLIIEFFESTSMTHEDFMKSVSEVLKVSSPSPARSEKLGGRTTMSSSRIISEGRYASTSITGLKYKKPKQLIKFLESKNEL